MARSEWGNRLVCSNQQGGHASAGQARVFPTLAEQQSVNFDAALSPQSAQAANVTGLCPSGTDRGTAITADPLILES